MSQRRVSVTEQGKCHRARSPLTLTTEKVAKDGEHRLKPRGYGKTRWKLQHNQLQGAHRGKRTVFTMDTANAAPHYLNASRVGR